MRDENKDRNRADSGEQGAHELDPALDAALANYTAAEPRAGLEARVLANLRAQPERAPHRSWWNWRAAGAVATVVVVALAFAWNSGRPSHPAVTANHVSPPAQSPMKEEKQAVSNLSSKQVRPRQPSTAVNARVKAVAAANPKLDQFPSPQPLSEQEKLLQNYVAQYPEHAVLVARALTRAIPPDQLKGVTAFPSSDEAPDSPDQNDDTRER